MQATFENDIARIPESLWDALVPADMPFLRHAFLHALEASGAVSPETGWEPCHVCIRDAGEVIALAPGYIKQHSYGEYVFDWSWAEAYHRHGLAYYPKYVTAVPFTPVTGPRLLVTKLHQNDAEWGRHVQACYHDAVIEMLRTRGCSSWHLLFPEEHHGAGQLMRRTGTQFHWVNKGYAQFDDFLASLSASRRKSIRKERQRVVQSGVQCVWRDGANLTPEEQDSVYGCYAATYLKRGQAPYLNADFFARLWRTMPQTTRVLLVRRDATVMAVALFFQGERTLYGRYWGCTEEVPGLHFEACYYQGIEYCIRHGLQRFDAGAQGEHKLLRGFEPVTTQSFHWLDHPEFAHAIQHFVQEEAQAVSGYQQQARNYLPFKKGEN